MTEEPQKPSQRDPASLNAELTISGMDLHEATAVFRAIPAGRTVWFEVSQPVVGGPRYQASVMEMSTTQARNTLSALIDHAQAIWDGKSPAEASGGVGMTAEQKAAAFGRGDRSDG